MKKDYKGPVEYSIEMILEKLENLLKGQYPISKRSMGLLLFQEDVEIHELVKKNDPHAIPEIEQLIDEIRTRYANHISYELALERQREVKDIVRKVVRIRKENVSFQERLSRVTMNPVTGLPVLFLVLYWGLYKFVGRFGAGTIVDFLEGSVFERHLNPFIIKAAEHIIPWPVLQDLFVGEYGMITLGFRYAVALILPIVTFFFIFFSIIEDTGYLPRLAMLIDRTFKKIGMSGRAVIPMVLGFGCVTMATMVTRTLATKRERIIATILLALAVPCSAQLGVMLALLSSRPNAAFLWAGIIGFIFLFVGFLTSRILPGERPSFYMEVPPLRLPKFSNIISKTYVRVKWYFKEVLPLFLLASFFIWAGKLTGLFDLIIRLLSGPVKLLGLPPEASKAFLFGFFRRDYGAAGLYDLNKQGMLNGVQLVVSCVTLTLFLPCIAQFLMNIKERGWKTGLVISVFVLFFSFGVGYIVNMALTRLGVII
ncbi:MAG: nucleoside recognition domain-containing protein [Candidatus Omnitrophota bacterium]